MYQTECNSKTIYKVQKLQKYTLRIYTHYIQINQYFFHIEPLFLLPLFFFFFFFFYLAFYKQSVQFSCSVVSDSLWPHGLQHTRLPCASPTPGVYSNSSPSSQRCNLTTSSSVLPLSSRLQSFPASGSFPMNQLFAWGGQSIGVSTSASVLPMNIQDWFPFGWTGLISLQSKGLSRIFSNTTVQNHQFFGAQVFL